MNTLLRKFRYAVLSVFCLSNCFLLFSDPHLILAGVPKNLGLKNNLFAPCPITPNCVSSQEKDSQHFIEPITFGDSLEKAKIRIYRVINSMRGTRIIIQENLYLHVEFTTKLLRFTDDVEFYFDKSQSLIHVRSASRQGYWDLGVNRRRVETIRSRFQKLIK